MLKLLLTSIKKWLNKPFPFFENYKQKILIPIGFSLLVMLGLIILNPSENIDILLKHVLNVFTYGSVVIFISLIFSLGLPEIFTTIFDTEKWNVLKTITFILLTILTIGIAISLIVYYFDNPNDLNLFSFFIAVIIRSITLSFFPIIIIVFYFEGVLHKKNNSTALKIIDEINKDRQLKQKQEKNISFIFAKNTKDEIKLNEKELLFIKAEANYCLLFFITNGIITKQLIRSSLKSIERVVNESDRFVRCHKSYIININKVYNVTGNAKGYTFHLNEGEYKIPVSRNISKSLIAGIKSN